MENEKKKELKFDNLTFRAGKVNAMWSIAPSLNIWIKSKYDWICEVHFLCFAIGFWYKSKIKFHTEYIKCPNCGKEQHAKVEHTKKYLFSYVHWCINCDECIMESEWNKVEKA